MGCILLQRKLHHRDAETQRRRKTKVVIPAKAGIHLAGNALVDPWIPAFAGMTRWGRPPAARHSGAMPFSVSSLIAFWFFARWVRPMPRSTLAALVNWMLS